MRIATTALIAAAAGCAKSPEDIQAASLPPSAYAGASCADLAAADVSAATQLEDASRRQREAQTGDAVGVFLIGIPMASLGGNDAEAEIASLKGQRAAIQQARAAQDCPDQGSV